MIALFVALSLFFSGADFIDKSQQRFARIIYQKNMRNESAYLDFNTCF